MTRIAIKDLTESVNLDHEAMTAISGGARMARHQPFASPSLAGERLVDFPWNVNGALPQDARARQKPPSR